MGWIEGLSLCNKIRARETALPGHGRDRGSLG